MLEPGQSWKTAALKATKCVYLLLCVGDTVDKYIEECLKEAKKSLKTDDVPIGAVIVQNGKIIGRGHNTREKEKLVTRHAEINALEQACKKKKDWYLNDCEIYVTLEPCPMCLNALAQARISKIHYLTARDKIEHVKEPIKEQCAGTKEAQQLLSKFFKAKRIKSRK